MAAVRSAAMLRRTLLTVVAAAAVLAGCGDDPDPPSTSQAARPPGTSVGATSVPTPDTTGVSGTAPGGDEEAAVLAAVDCYWQTIVEANDPPNPDHPGFARCFTGAALETSRAHAAAHGDKGEYVNDPTGVVEWRGLVGDIEDDRAFVTVCIVDDAVVFAANGTVVNDDVVSYIVNMKLLREGDAWRVADISTSSRKEGRWNCVD